MVFKRKIKINPVDKLREVAIAYARRVTDDEWGRFKKAVEGYRKADKIMSGEHIDSDIGDLAEQMIET